MVPPARVTGRRRRDVILHAVGDLGYLSIGEVMQHAGISAATARRDIRLLANDGLVRLTRAGVAAALKDDGSRGFGLPDPRHQDAARLAAGMVRAGETIAIGAGLLPAQLAAALVDVPDLTIVTNSLLVCMALDGAPGIEVLMTAGVVRPLARAVDGALVNMSLTGLRVSTLFLSADGVTGVRGLSRHDVALAEVDKGLVATAQRVVGIAEAACVGLDSMVQTVPIARLSGLVSTAEADPVHVDKLRRAGVTVVV